MATETRYYVAAIGREDFVRERERKGEEEGNADGK
jgi:hypothetical protein